MEEQSVIKDLSLYPDQLADGDLGSWLTTDVCCAHPQMEQRLRGISLARRQGIRVSGVQQRRSKVRVR